MGFWQQVGVQALAGFMVAVVAAILAWWLGGRYSARRAEQAAVQARDLAATEELYRAYGEFFAVWKAWTLHTDTTPGRGHVPPTPERRTELVEKAGTVEALYEAFLVRVTSERLLNPDQQAALWALRFAFKQLRYAIVQGVALPWRRSGKVIPAGAREYEAMKALMSAVARFTAAPRRAGEAPTSQQARQQLATVTGTGAEVLDRPYVRLRLEDPSARAVPSAGRGRAGWQWVVVAEVVCAGL